MSKLLSSCPLQYIREEREAREVAWREGKNVQMPGKKGKSTIDQIREQVRQTTAQLKQNSDALARLSHGSVFQQLRGPFSLVHCGVLYLVMALCCFGLGQALCSFVPRELLAGSIQAASCYYSVGPDGYSHAPMATPMSPRSMATIPIRASSSLLRRLASPSTTRGSDSTSR